MSGFIRFKSPEEATDNRDLLMRFMASNTVGDTADPKNFFGVSQYILATVLLMAVKMLTKKQPETPPSIQGPSGVGASQEQLSEGTPDNRSRLSLTIGRQGSVRMRNFLSSIRNRPRVVSGGRDIFERQRPEDLPEFPPCVLNQIPKGVCSLGRTSRKYQAPQLQSRRAVTLSLDLTNMSYAEGLFQGTSTHGRQRSQVISREITSRVRDICHAFWLFMLFYFIYCWIFSVGFSWLEVG